MYIKGFLVDYSNCLLYNIIVVDQLEDSMFYHLSTKKNLKYLTPRIPECAVSLYEDVATKRVCFSDSIEGCLSAIQQGPAKYYVYIVAEDPDNFDIHYPTVDEVRDAKFTHEVWILTKVKVKCVGVITCDNWDWKKQHNSGRGRITYFHYPYHWIEQYD